MFANKKDPTKFYTQGEEIFNAITHGVGSVLSIAGLTLLVTLSACFATWREVIACAVYGFSLIMLYTMSTLYHAFTSVKVKRILRVFDHTSIFLLIAGTYTPITLITLQSSTKGIIIFFVVWAAAIIGIIANAIALDKVEKLSLVLYVVMGWAVVFAFNDVLRLMPFGGLMLLLAGGIAYTGGVAFYKSKHKYMHSVWHLFVLAGSILHFLCVVIYVLPAAYVT